MYMFVVRQGPSVSNFGKLEIPNIEFVSLVWVSSIYSNLRAGSGHFFHGAGRVSGL